MRTSAPTDDLPRGLLAAFVVYMHEYGMAPCAFVLGVRDGRATGFQPGIWKRGGNGIWNWDSFRQFPDGNTDFMVPVGK